MTLRQAEDFLGKLNRKDFRFTKKENNEKRALYRSAIGKCCMPGCNFGLMLEVHHIEPIKKGGKDEFINFIVLCSHCHRHSKIHRYSEKRKIELLVYKLFQEGTIINETSDDYSDEEYWKVLKNKVNNCHFETRKLTIEEKRKLEVNYEENA